MTAHAHIPLPPRTPTPPSDITPGGLGFQVSVPSADVTYDPDLLSPDMQQTDLSTPATSYFTPAVPDGIENAPSPFNFQTVTLAKSPITKSVRLCLYTETHC